MRYIGTYSTNGQIAVLVEVAAPNQIGYINPEFVEQLVALCEDIAIHVATSNPADIAELLNQPFIKNSDQSILELLIEKSKPIDGSITVSRFIRWDTSTPNPENDPRLDLAMQVKK